ncbi:15263_t:CDS:2, partial [Acaulospora morrowiae]
DTKKFAAGLHDKVGFKRGDVLAIVSPNQVDYPIVLFGAIAAGGIVSPANPTYTVKELSFQLSNSGASMIISYPSCLSTIIEAAAEVGIPRSKIFLIGDKEVDGFQPYSTLFIDREFEPVEYTPEEVKNTVAILCYSSGTTGKSKGVQTTHTNIIANVEQFISIDKGLSQKEVFMGVLPFFHIYGLNLLLHAVLILGASTVLIPKFDLATFCRVVQDYKVTYGHLVPPIILLLVKDPTVKEYDLSSLRVIVNGAAPLSKSLIDDMLSIHNITVKQGYGLTETSPVISVDDEKGSTKGIYRSVGKLLPNIEAKIIAENGQELDCNQPGQLCVRGPNVMKGYLNNEEANNAAFDSDGFLYTGDVAFIDDQGQS